MSEKLFTCACEREGITLDFEPDVQIVNLAMWERGYGPYRKTFWERIKKAWRVLTKGHLYADQMCFDYTGAMEFANGLLEVADQMKVAEQEMFDRLKK